MKKLAFLLLFAIAVLTSGCADEAAQASQTIPAAETGSVIENSGAAENIIQENSGLADYMASIEEQSAAIEDFLEKDAMTQLEMNEKSQELYELWDDALNYLWSELKAGLPENEFAELLNEQRAWIAEKEEVVEEAGKDFEGGSIYALIVNSEAAAITKERVYELYEILKDADQ